MKRFYVRFTGSLTCRQHTAKKSNIKLVFKKNDSDN